MNKIEPIELLKNPDVIKEIHQHLWIESEKAGYDIGLSWAAEDWMNRYAQLWIESHMPGKTIFSPLTPDQTLPENAPDDSLQTAGKDRTPERVKKRRAKSYFR